jgi:cytochrome c peroxidase
MNAHIGRLTRSLYGFFVGWIGIAGLVMADELAPRERLGQLIFFDKQLAIKRNQACAVCHGPREGWTGPEERLNVAGAVYEGSIKGRFGNRKPPSSAYATYSPVLHYVEENGEKVFIGGNFWDGRATGHKLGNPAADQAQGPFLNPVEQALPDSACVVYRVCHSGRYGKLFKDVWPGACDINWPRRNEVNRACSTEGGKLALSPEDRVRSDRAFDDVARSIAAFENSPASNQFSSKFDAYLAGKAQLTPEEQRGLALFKGDKAKCANCHTLDRGPQGESPLFTDFTYDNIGVPRNPDNPWYTQPAFNPDGKKWVDLGLGGFLASTPTDSLPDFSAYAEENYGKHKVPTLRNVDKRPHPSFTKAYMHNGYFKTLKGLVHFYNTRDVKPRCPDFFTREADALAQGCWPEPEMVANVNTEELGHLGLTEQEEDEIVAFLRTLSDGFVDKRK